VVAILEEKKLIEMREGTVALTAHKVVLSAEEHKKIYSIDQYILNQKMRTPLWSTLKKFGLERGIEEKRLKLILFYLVSRKRIIHLDGEYIHNLIVEPIKKKLLDYLITHSEGISVSEFRDLVNGNRKICVILLNMFDNEGILRRIEDRRYITDKGKELLQSIP
jgi:selenocysteine-specific elongation factor